MSVKQWDDVAGQATCSTHSVQAGSQMVLVKSEKAEHGACDGILERASCSYLQLDAVPSLMVLTGLSPLLCLTGW